LNALEHQLLIKSTSTNNHIPHMNTSATVLIDLNTSAKPYLGVINTYGRFWLHWKTSYEL